MCVYESSERHILRHGVYNASAVLRLAFLIERLLFVLG